MNVVERPRQMAGATRVVLRCLGRFRIEDISGDQLLPRSRKARAILAALAVSGRPLSRDRLADLLWSERGTVQARSSLRQAVFELQHLEQAGEPILAVSRDDLALRPDLAVTDIALIRGAAEDGDWPRLLVLLEGSEPGLLGDLDGLDPELDDWLRLERAQEPAKTLAVAIDAAERCVGEAGPRAAQGIVAEVLRLDPANEEATRLALAIDHQLGDNVALHRRYAALRERLREDYGAEPSAQTAELFRQLTEAAPASGSRQPEARQAAEPLETARPAAKRFPLLAALAVLAIAAAVAIGLLLWRADGTPGPGSDPILLAVLPFEQQPRGDGFLAEGLWDDTRLALSRDSGLQVLGRATSKALSERRLAPLDYRRRLGVDYLLDGTVRRSGDQVVVAVSLTRTKDGIGLWEQVFTGQLGDPLALQDAIARGIEGRLRGRLARGGGRRAEQISTTPEVYSLYSEARALLRTRDTEEAKRADRLLRRALVLDPNFAPAWASLASAAHFGSPSPSRHAVDREQAIRYVRHAIELAPNLAEAHATLALVAGPGDRRSESALERALALDPGNAEAWNWLGNVRSRQFRLREAAQAYSRAIDIDPLFFPAGHNLAQLLADNGDLRGASQLVARLRKTGADRGMLVTTRGQILISTGDYSAAAGELLGLARERASQRLSDGYFGLGEVFFRLGYFEEGAKAWRLPAGFAPVMRGRRAPPDELIFNRAAFWRNDFDAAYGGRALVNLGKGNRFVSLYRTAFETPEEFVETASENGILEVTAPTLSVALRQSGDSKAADFILAATANRLEQFRKRAPNVRDLLWQLAAVRAAGGQDEEALRLMAEAVNRGWLPDGVWHALDIADEPAFRGLRGEPRFEAIRRRFLNHVARERAELGPVKV